jgi:flagellar basal-body rod modification protein FlgD
MASTLPVTSTGATQQTKTDTTAMANKAQDKQNQFLQLLVAQLKGQNPLDPLDGTQFVAQLAQFSSLEELVGIHSVLQDLQKVLVPNAQKTADPVTGQ